MQNLDENGEKANKIWLWLKSTIFQATDRQKFCPKRHKFLSTHVHPKAPDKQNHLFMSTPSPIQVKIHDFQHFQVKYYTIAPV